MVGLYRGLFQPFGDKLIGNIVLLDFTGQILRSRWVTEVTKKEEGQGMGAVYTRVQDMGEDGREVERRGAALQGAAGGKAVRGKGMDR